MARANVVLLVRGASPSRSEKKKKRMPREEEKALLDNTEDSQWVLL